MFSWEYLEGSRDRAEYASRVHELLREGKAVMDASCWLPLQTSVIRDKDILELMPDAGEEEIDAYLDEYTKSLQKYKDVYLEAKERRK